MDVPQKKRAEGGPVLFCSVTRWFSCPSLAARKFQNGTDILCDAPEAGTHCDSAVEADICEGPLLSLKTGTYMTLQPASRIGRSGTLRCCCSFLKDDEEKCLSFWNLPARAGIGGQGECFTRQRVKAAPNCSLRCEDGSWFHSLRRQFASSQFQFLTCFSATGTSFRGM